MWSRTWTLASVARLHHVCPHARKKICSGLNPISLLAYKKSYYVLKVKYRWRTVVLTDALGDVFAWAWKAWYAICTPPLSAMFSPRVKFPFTFPIAVFPSSENIVKLLYWLTRQDVRFLNSNSVPLLHHNSMLPSPLNFRPESSKPWVNSCLYTVKNKFLHISTLRTP